MPDNYLAKHGRFAGSRRLVWAVILMTNTLMLLLAFLADDLGQLSGVFTAGITGQLGLAVGWSGITNWSEIKRP
jgi:hypothetical protein